jgi:Holliday junction resolvase RusA-like endonuclease
MLDARRDKSRKEHDAWKLAVGDAAINAQRFNSLLDGALAVTVTFYLAPPKTETRAERARVWHTTRCDIDKLARTVFDVLTGTVITDDSRIAITRLEKRFARDRAPGADVSVTQIPDGE